MKTIGGLIVSLTLGLVQIVQSAQAPKVHRIGHVSTAFGKSAIDQAIFQDLRERGYVEGQNLIIESRFAEGKLDRLPELIAELVRLKVDLIIVSSTQAVLLAKRATQTIPILFAIADNPVDSGVVASLARPGGNATGLTDIAGELGGKRLEILKETVPKLSRLGLLVWTPDGPGNAAEKSEIEAAARVFKVRVQPVQIRGTDDLAKGFSAMTKAGVGAFMGLTDTRFSNNRPRIIELSAQHRLPAIYPEQVFADAGGLMSYGTNRIEFRRRLAIYIDKILKGTKPEDLPVEQPMKFEFVINLKTAKQLNLTIPQWTLMKADRVIR
jgi:putative ABC transport system substrate-binding protein